MSGHLYIHIGPPKTATTSLQLGLQRLSDPSFSYLGVRQPRNPQSIDESKVLYSYASGDLSDDAVELLRAIKNIKDLTSSGITVFISEEMFLVWHATSSFWDKLRRLEAVIADIPHSYVMTLRDPIDALPSYYQELHSGLPISEKRNEKRFFLHERCDCYDYMKVIHFIESLDQRVLLVDFDYLSKGTIDLSAILGTVSHSFGAIELSTENAGVKSTNKKRQLAPVTISDITRSGPLKRVKELMRERAPTVFDRAKSALGKLEVTRRVDRVVNISEPRLSDLRHSYFSALKHADFNS